MKRKRKEWSVLEVQEHRAFELYESLQSVLADLKRIDSLIPSEASRTNLFASSEEDAAIIEARKKDLLGYIQTICRDHLHYGKVQIDSGWKAATKNQLVFMKFKGPKTVPHDFGYWGEGPTSPMTSRSPRIKEPKR